MSQFSTTADRLLNTLSVRIGIAEGKIEAATADKKEAWDKVFETLEEFNGNRFIAGDGHYLYKQKRGGTPKLDEAKLKQILYERLPRRDANRIWKAITEPKVNSDLLELAVQQHVISAGMVSECITTPDPTYARIREEWTKEDVDRAAVFGVNR